MKRYWLFVYAHYYPCGGMNDFVGSYGTLEEAKEVADKRERYDRDYHIFDALIGQAIEGDIDAESMAKQLR